MPLPTPFWHYSINTINTSTDTTYINESVNWVMSDICIHTLSIRRSISASLKTSWEPSSPVWRTSRLMTSVRSSRLNSSLSSKSASHDDVINWKHFLRYWPFVRGIHRSPVNSPHKGQWSGALMFSLICVWTNGWLNNRDAGDWRRRRPHYNITVIPTRLSFFIQTHLTL